jgi:hypothetical protein
LNKHLAIFAFLRETLSGETRVENQEPRVKKIKLKTTLRLPSTPFDFAQGAAQGAAQGTKTKKLKL